MGAKFFLRHHFLPSSAFASKLLPPSKLPLCKPTFISFFSVARSTCQFHTQTPVQFPDLKFSYGPSFRKGSRPPQHFQPSLRTAEKNHLQDQNQPQLEGGNDDIIDRDSFARVFDIAALRVPSKDCFVLESRLRGHLLNWPRVRNIARVSGDEFEDEIAKILGEEINPNADDGEESFVSLQRRIYGKAEGDGESLSPVLYREKLAKTFNSRGFVKFRNLAKISRPKKKRNRKSAEKKETSCKKKGLGKNDYAVVEVVDDEGDEEDMSGLLGDGLRGRSCRGSTRLLLLDERYANKGVEELPEAMKAVLKEKGEESTRPSIELVRCKLTLFYDYWQMNEVLEALLPEGMIVPSAFETVGHIAHLNLKVEHLPYKKLIAKVVLDKNKPKIQTVVNKIDAIHNDYRTMELEVLAGNHSLVTTVVENGLHFHVDLATVYWNSRLATERQRLVNGFTCNDVVCDVFSGVGPIAISSAKIVKRVYANDLNPYAVEYLERNSVVNRLEKKIEVYNMDGRRFINAMFTSEKAHSITQVIMNLPSDAAEFLDAFRGVFKDRPKSTKINLPTIHVYGFSKARDPEFDFHERIRIGLSEVAVDVEMRKVRLVAPGKWMLCASFVLPESVAFRKPMLNI